MRWVLIPGLGADQRLFTNMLDLVPDHQVIRFEIPREDETIEQYALRLAQQITAADSGLVLCGISFGGMLSTILAGHLDPQALVVMSSTSDPAALSKSARVFEWLSRVWPNTLADWVCHLGKGAASWVEPLGPEQAAVFQAMIHDAPIELIRRSGRMIMGWHETPQTECPRFHLHGALDMLMPVDRVAATCVIEDAGHLLNLTHPAAVRRFISEIHDTL